MVRVMSIRPAALLAVAVLVGATTTLPHDAATSAAAAPRCTIVGTSHADHLSGTSHRDVICGLGGDDVLSGRGGDDLVEGGSGDDRINGGAGDDRVHGQDGDDTIYGAGGDDSLSGNAGDDRIVAGSGADLLYGGSGSDDLDGGPGHDRLDGGSGTNWCVPSRDGLTGCLPDELPPVADDVSMSTHAVDVTAADRAVTVRVHGTDDTGITRVTVGLSDPDSSRIIDEVRAARVSGDVRDGQWSARVVVPRWTAPGTFSLTVAVGDRAGRQGGGRLDRQVLAVADSTPDVTGPSASLLGPASTTTYTVTAGPRPVRVRARVRDAGSGVGTVYACLYHPASGSYERLPCRRAHRESGTLHDGVWRADVTIPAGSTSGDWDVSVRAADAARLGPGVVEWAGPDLYRVWTGDGAVTSAGVRGLPDGRGGFTVVGHGESAAPQVTGAGLGASTVDTSLGPRPVPVTVHAADAHGVGSAGARLRTATGAAGEGAAVRLSRTAGTARAGTWTGTLVLPEDTPSGTYYLQAWVADGLHWRSYVSPGTAYADRADQRSLPEPVTVRVQNSG